MKKYAVIILCILLLGSVLAGCGQRSTAVTELETTAAQTTGTAMESMQEFSITASGLVIQDAPVTIDGYVLSDGIPAPVSVTIQIDGVLTGQEAYESLVYQDPEISAPPQGQEYILALLTVTYEDGVLEKISLERNQATAEGAGLYFALSNGDGNAVDVSDSLNNSLYKQTLWEGDSVGAAVAFLQEEGNTQPLTFVGFGQVAAFSKEASEAGEAAQASPDREAAEKLKAFSLDFMNAYLLGDTERMKQYLETVTAEAPEVYSGLDFLVQVVPISAWETWVQELEAEGSCEVSLPFTAKPTDDFYTYLTMEITSRTGEWKISFYGLEG